MRRPSVRKSGIVPQAAIGLGLLVLIAWFLSNAIRNMAKAGIASGFDFLDRPAGFDIGFKLIEFSPADDYARVFTVGLCNTLLVAGLSILTASLVGFSLGIARLSRHWLVGKVAILYIEIIRNIPLMLQLLFWYIVVLTPLPGPSDALSLGHFAYLCNRGLYLPRLVFPFHLDFPVLERFNFSGGLRFAPELLALWLSLTLYVGAFIGETVRAGIQSVGKGRSEAAAALGLPPGRAMLWVILPQAMRAIVPPLTGQYLNILKNSSLAIVIGYPDLVAVFAGSALNLTGQAIETIAMTMIFYLVTSLLLSAAMNAYNRRVALAGV